MRVLIFEPTGGFWPYTPNISKAVSKENTINEVILLTSVNRKNSKVEDVILKAECRGMNVKISREKRLRWLFDRCFTSLQWLKKRTEIIKEIKPEILHIQSTPSIFDQYVLPKIKGKTKIIITVHDVLPLTKTFFHSYKSLRRIYNYADALIVHSKSNKQELTEKMGIQKKKIYIIPHIMDNFRISKVLPSEFESKEKLGLKQDNDYLLFFGSIRKSKGPDRAIKAIADLKKKRNNICLIIAGSSHWDVDIDELKDLINNNGLEDRVVLHLGYIPDELLDYYFCASKIVLLPYIEFHSQSGVLLQAYTYKKPVVATNKGSLGETIYTDKTGLVIEKSESILLAEAVLTLLENQSLYDSCAYNQQKAIEEKYNSSIISKKTIEVYKL